MLTVGFAGLDADGLERFERAAPDADFVHVPSMGVVDRFATRTGIEVLVLGQEALRQRGYARLSALTARHPHIAAVGYVEPNAALPTVTHMLGRAGCHVIVVRGTDDGPEPLREALALATLRAAAATAYAASAPAPPILTPPSLERVLRSIRKLHIVSALAAAFGLPLSVLRDQLRQGGVFPPLVLLAWLRLFAGSVELQHRRTSVERAGLAAGYSSATAFHDACRQRIGITPGEMRGRGGLRYVGERYRDALATWRERRMP